MQGAHYSKQHPQLYSLGSCRQYMSVFLLEDDVCLTGGRFGNLMVSNHDKAGCISMFFLFFVYVIVKWGFNASCFCVMCKPHWTSEQCFDPGRSSVFPSPSFALWKESLKVRYSENAGVCSARWMWFMTIMEVIEVYIFIVTTDIWLVYVSKCMYR